MQDNIKRHDWGYEITWAQTEDYTGKVIVFEKPAKSDIVFHSNTNKSYFVNQGKFSIKWIDTKDGKVYENNLGEGGTTTIKKLVPHSIECVSATGSLSEVNNGELKDDTHTVLPAKNLGENNVSTING